MAKTINLFGGKDWEQEVPDIEDYRWAMAHYAIEDIGIEDAPSRMAWTLLHMARHSGNDGKAIREELTRLTQSGGNIEDDRAIETTGIAEATRAGFSEFLGKVRGLLEKEVPDVLGRAD